ncbi:unnamed protein product [Rotaria sp. Silwood2]|nr:unnamed protein product [Rotaria sp. Silwood2]CAF4154151.1 unnamed protein product [Rotaria sp. Silwood2]
MWTISTTTTIFLLALVCVMNAEKSINWTGYQWFVYNGQKAPPGPNNWSSNNVWVDQNNSLHLKLSYSPTTGGWTCAELYTKKKFSFGTFRWFVEGAIDKFDPNVVLGLFTYGGVDYINEIDIEVAKWGVTKPDALNMGFTVYPNTFNISKPIQLVKRVSSNETYTTHQFTWTSDKVSFLVQDGFMESPNQNILYSYQTPKTFASSVPYTSAPLCMNLWLMYGRAPMNGKEMEIIIHDFKYIKA